MSDKDERSALQRARYLVRTTDLNDREALALSYRELGYSHSAIAREIDSTKGTVSGWLDRVVAQYGLRAVETKTRDERGDLAEVTPDRLIDLPKPIREQYAEYAQREPEYVPAAVAEQLGWGGGE